MKVMKMILSIVGLDESLDMSRWDLDMSRWDLDGISICLDGLMKSDSKL